MNCGPCWERKKKAIPACPESKSLNMCRLCFFGDDPDRRVPRKQKSISRARNMKLVEPYIAVSLRKRTCDICGVEITGSKSFCDEHLKQSQKVSTIRHWVRKWAETRDTNALSNAAYHIRKCGITPEDFMRS